MNLDVVKVVDCLDMYYMKRQCSILNDGKLIGFQPKEEKEIPTQTANPSGDKQPVKAITMSIIAVNQVNVNEKILKGVIYVAGIKHNDTYS